MAVIFKLTRNKDSIHVIINATSVKTIPEIKTCLNILKRQGWKAETSSASDIKEDLA